VVKLDPHRFGEKDKGPKEGAQELVDVLERGRGRTSHDG
jgi:hypothetical protein